MSPVIGSPTVPCFAPGIATLTGSRVSTCASLPPATTRQAMAEPMLPAPMMVTVLMVSSLIGCCYNYCTSNSCRVKCLLAWLA